MSERTSRSQAPDSEAVGYPGVGRVLVVIPTYNEADNVRGIVERVRRAVPGADLLIADDNSPDGTGAIADELAARDRHVHVLHRPGKQGLGAAYLAGFSWAREQEYDAVVEMDADGSHAPEQLPELLAAAREADLVLGSRWVHGGQVVNWPVHRLVLSRGANLYTRLALGMPIKDATGGRAMAHLIRAKTAHDGSAGWHKHSLHFQMYYVIRGWIKFDYEGVGEVLAEAGSCVHQPPGIRHKEVAHSDDLELIEITLPADFSPDRGFTKTLLGRGGYTIDANRNIAFEMAIRQNGNGVWLKSEYSQLFHQHWRATLNLTLVDGDDGDFLGQYHRNSHAMLVVRYSF